MSADPTGADPTAADPEGADGSSDADEVAAAAERDALRARVELLENRAGRRQRLRRVGTAVLVLLTCLSFTLTTASLWSRRSFLNTEVFSQRVGPLAQDPDVKAALERLITAEVTAAVDVKRLLQEVLPERGQILAVPLSNAIEGFVAGQVDRFVASPEFERLWAASTTRAHQAAVRLLRGESTPAGSVENGAVKLNLVPIINGVLAYIGAQSPELLGRTVNLPELTVDDLPDAARARLETALGIDLDDGFGEITVFESENLATAQDAVAAFDKATVALVILTLLLIPLTLWASTRRRRTLLQLLVGIALGMVLLRRVAFFAESQVLAQVKVPENEPAVRVIERAFLDPLLRGCAWVIAAAAIVALVTALTGPYPWAVRLRRAVAAAGRGLGTIVTEGSKDERTVAWLRLHRDHLRIGEVALAVLVLLFLDLPWWGLAVVAALIGATELALARVKPEQPSVLADEAEPEPTPTGA